MAGKTSSEGQSLQYTPTWEIALICAIVITISFLVERGIHKCGKRLKKNKILLYEVLEKVKEELMLLGLISLLLIFFAEKLSKIQIKSHSSYDKFLPCKNETVKNYYGDMEHKNEEIPFMSNRAFHGVHLFIFTLAVVHVGFSGLTILLGRYWMRKWKRWESAASEFDIENAQNGHKRPITQSSWRWLQSYFKQFYRPMTKSEYISLRHEFLIVHCGGKMDFNFHEYLIDVLEVDFKKVVGISWKLWIFVVLYLLANVEGLRLYFWLSFLPLILTTFLGTNLEYVLIQRAHNVPKTSLQSVLFSMFFTHHQIVLKTIHFILFQNAFEMAMTVWMTWRYGFDSCMMGPVGFGVTRIAIGLLSQLICSLSTLPLYVLVSQTGGAFNKKVLQQRLETPLVSCAATVKGDVNGGASHESIHAESQIGNGGQKNHTSGDQVVGKMNSGDSG